MKQKSLKHKLEVLNSPSPSKGEESEKVKHPLRLLVGVELAMVGIVLMILWWVLLT